MSNAGKWGYRTGEVYVGAYDTPEEAASARCEGPDGTVRVGQYREPRTPESCVDGQDLIDMVLCQDDYDNESGYDELGATAAQVAELTDDVRRVFGEWIDKHDLRPTFGIVETTMDL